MNNDTQHNGDSQKSIRQRVLERIKSGKVRRVPRAYFILRIIGTVIVSVLVLLASAAVASFVLFSLHESGEQFLLGFGWQGILVFLKLFPWTTFLFDLVLLFLLEWFLQGFKFGYRIPLLNIFLGLLVISIVVGGLINVTPLQGKLLQHAENDQLPIVGPLYEHIFDHHDDDGVCRGVVVSVSDSEFSVMHDDFDRDTDDGTFAIGIPAGSHLQVPHVGDRVLVFGAPPVHPDQYNQSSSSAPYLEARNIQILQPSSGH